MSGEYYKYKSLFLGLGKTLDEKWEIDIELRNPKTVSLSKYSLVYLSVINVMRFSFIITSLKSSYKYELFIKISVKRY